MKKLIFLILYFSFINYNSQTIAEKQMINARATGYAVVAAKNPGVDFSIFVVPWDGVNSLEYNANNQINPYWHAQAAIKGNYFNQDFQENDFARYSSVVTSEEEFNKHKSTIGQWWIVCSTLPPFSSQINSEIGNVGIGTNTPSSKLDVRGTISTPEIAFRNADGGDNTDPYRLRKVQRNYNNNWLELQLNDDADESFRIYGASCIGFGCREYSGNLYHSFDTSGNVYHAGNVGIGTSNPKAKLDIDFGGEPKTIKFLETPNAINTMNAMMRFSWYNNTADFGLVRSVDSNIEALGFRFNGEEKARITPSGNMSLQGKLEAKEVKVVQVPTADFVFEKEYKLPTLEEVEKHIKEKKHLPEIASAKQMEKEGLNVGEFQIKLLQKIEELTLYSIEQNKLLKRQAEKIERLEKDLHELKQK